MIVPRAGEAHMLTYRRPALDDAERLLGWRTRPDITRFMFTDIEHDVEKQRAWLAACETKPGFVHRIICIGAKPVGYASITVVDAAAKVGTVGVYLADIQNQPGVTAFNFIHALNHAFYTVGLNKIVNHILEGNTRVIRAQKYNGYRHVGVLRQHVRKYEKLHDVYVFEQLRAEWVRFREKFRDYRDFDGVERL